MTTDSQKHSEQEPTDNNEGAEQASESENESEESIIDVEYTAPIAEAVVPEEIETTQKDTEQNGEIVVDGFDEGEAAESNEVITEDESEEDANTDDSEIDIDSRTIIEALVFASDEPLTFKQIKDVLQNGNSSKTESSENEQESGETEESPQPRKKRSKKDAKIKLTIGKVRKWIDSLNTEYSEQGRPFRVVEVAGGFAHQTISEYGQYVGKLYTERSKRRLTQSALETLSIIAYKQPLSKPGVEAIRGVNADYVVKSLLEKGLIAIVGREDSVGRPLLYGTTKQFLKHFGLHSLQDLPKPREIEELLKESEEELAPPIEISDDSGTLPHAHDFDAPSIFDDVYRDPNQLNIETVDNLEHTVQENPNGNNGQNEQKAATANNADEAPGSQTSASNESSELHADTDNSDASNSENQ